MKLWHAETVSGSVQDLETALNRIVNSTDATVVGMTGTTGQFGPSWTVVWYTYQRDAPSEAVPE